MSVEVYIPPSEHWCGTCCVFHLGTALCPWAGVTPAPGVPIVGPYPSASLRLPAPSILDFDPLDPPKPRQSARCATCRRAPRMDWDHLDCAECIADHAASLALAPETVRPS